MADVRTSRAKRPARQPQRVRLLLTAGPKVRQDVLGREIFDHLELGGDLEPFLEAMGGDPVFPRESWDQLWDMARGEDGSARLDVTWKARTFPNPISLAAQRRRASCLLIRDAFDPTRPDRVPRADYQFVYRGPDGNHLGELDIATADGGRESVHLVTAGLPEVMADELRAMSPRFDGMLNLSGPRTAPAPDTPAP